MCKGGEARGQTQRQPLLIYTEELQVKGILSHTSLAGSLRGVAATAVWLGPGVCPSIPAPPGILCTGSKGRFPSVVQKSLQKRSVSAHFVPKGWK